MESWRDAQSGMQIAAEAAGKKAAQFWGALATAITIGLNIIALGISIYMK